jgi:signal transduction histidine kinase
MKLAYWVFWALITVAVSLLLLWPDQAPPGVTQISTVTWRYGDAPAKQVTLPRVDLAHSPISEMGRYSFELPRNEPRNEPQKAHVGNESQAIYISHAAPLFSVYLNDALIYDARLTNNREESSLNQPRLFLLPQLPKESDAQIEIRFAPVFKQQNNLLGTIWVGSQQSLSPVYERRMWIRIYGAQAMLLVYLIAAVGSFAFWLSDKSYGSPLWFALFCLSCAYVTFTGLILRSPPVSMAFTLHTTMFAVTCAACTLAQFVFDKTQRRSKAHDRLLIALLAIGTILAFVLYEDVIPFRYALVMDILLLIFGSYVIGCLVVDVVRKRDQLSLMLLAGVLVTFALCLLAVLVSWADVPAENYIAVYAPLPLLATMAWVIIRRYARTYLKTKALNRSLERRVSRREQEVRSALLQVASLEQEQAVRAERDRFMQDMHDGLGSQLVTSMRAAERGKLSHEDMRETLLSCLDEMHFAIESLKPTGDDLFTSLSEYRYRLDARLEAAGVSLRWRVTPSKVLKLNPSQVTQVLRIINEAITNALKHAEGHDLAVIGNVIPQDADNPIAFYSLIVKDGGNGLASDLKATLQIVQRGNGLSNMQRRAQSVGATIVIESDEQGTIVQLRLPLTS